MNKLNPETNAFIEELKSRDDVLGIILFGSWARGNNRDNSDVDLVVILKEGYRRSVEKTNNQVFEVIYVTADSALDYWKNKKDDAVSLWEVAQILFDRDGTVKELENRIREILNKGKPAIDSYQKEQLRFDVDDHIDSAEYLHTKDPTTANLILYNKVFELTSKVFDLKQLWIPSPKQRLMKIKEIDETLHDLIEEFYSEENFNERIKIAREITRQIFGK